jgi:hypothetical protein
MIVMETICLQTVEIYYCGGYVPLFVTMCHGLSSCVLSIDIVPTVIGDYPVG